MFNAILLLDGGLGENIGEAGSFLELFRYLLNKLERIDIMKKRKFNEIDILLFIVGILISIVGIFATICCTVIMLACDFVFSIFIAIIFAGMTIAVCVGIWYLILI